MKELKGAPEFQVVFNTVCSIWVDQTLSHRGLRYTESCDPELLIDVLQMLVHNRNSFQQGEKRPVKCCCSVVGPEGSSPRGRLFSDHYESAGGRSAETGEAVGADEHPPPPRRVHLLTKTKLRIRSLTRLGHCLKPATCRNPPCLPSFKHPSFSSSAPSLSQLALRSRVCVLGGGHAHAEISSTWTHTPTVTWKILSGLWICPGRFKTLDKPKTRVNR